ncbi:Pex12 amino terminal region-domain-containing protein, partial [Baffinella frigidus]
LHPRLLQDLKPESDALFGFVIAFFSICSGSQTPGNVFQNLVYVDRARTHLPSSRLAPPVRRQRIGYLLLFVVLPYIWARGSRVVERREWGARPEGEWRRRAWVLMQRLEAWYRCAATVNLVLFLRFTTYRTIGERLLRIGLEPQDATLTRTLNFEYTNQVLVWHTMQDILAQSRPFIAGTRNPKPEARNPKPETRNPKPETRSPKPEARSPKPETRNPKPEARNPKPEASSPHHGNFLNTRARRHSQNAVNHPEFPELNHPEFPSHTLLIGQRLKFRMVKHTVLTTVGLRYNTINSIIVTLHRR